MVGAWVAFEDDDAGEDGMMPAQRASRGFRAAAPSVPEIRLNFDVRNACLNDDGSRGYVQQRQSLLPDATLSRRMRPSAPPTSVIAAASLASASNAAPPSSPEPSTDDDEASARGSDADDDLNAAAPARATQEEAAVASDEDDERGGPVDVGIQVRQKSLDARRDPLSHPQAAPAEPAPTKAVHFASPAGFRRPEEDQYVRCMRKLDELESLVETQFRELVSGGYVADPLAAADAADSPLSTATLEAIEATIENAHHDLVSRGVLPRSAMRIFTEKDGL